MLGYSKKRPRASAFAAISNHLFASSSFDSTPLWVALLRRRMDINIHRRKLSSVGLSDLAPDIPESPTAQTESTTDNENAGTTRGVSQRASEENSKDSRSTFVFFSKAFQTCAVCCWKTWCGVGWRYLRGEQGPFSVARVRRSK